MRAEGVYSTAGCVVEFSKLPRTNGAKIFVRCRQDMEKSSSRSSTTTSTSPSSSGKQLRDEAQLTGRGSTAAGGLRAYGSARPEAPLLLPAAEYLHFHHASGMQGAAYGVAATSGGLPLTTGMVANVPVTFVHAGTYGEQQRTATGSGDHQQPGQRRPSSRAVTSLPPPAAAATQATAQQRFERGGHQQAPEYGHLASQSSRATGGEPPRKRATSGFPPSSQPADTQCQTPFPSKSLPSPSMESRIPHPQQQQQQQQRSKEKHSSASSLPGGGGSMQRADPHPAMDDRSRTTSGGGGRTQSPDKAVGEGTAGRSPRFAPPYRPGDPHGVEAHRQDAPFGGDSSREAAAASASSSLRAKPAAMVPLAMETEDVKYRSAESAEDTASMLEAKAGSFRQWTFEEQFRQLYSVDANPERKEFLDGLFEFMHKRGSPISRIPIMAKQTLDLFKLYTEVVDRGGLVEVINRKLWREIANTLQIPATITSSAFTLRVQYIKYLYPYECEMLQLSTTDDLAAAIDGNKRDILRISPMSPTRAIAGSSQHMVRTEQAASPLRVTADTPPTPLPPMHVYSLTPSLAMAAGGHVRTTSSLPEVQVAHAITPSGVPVFFASPPTSQVTAAPVHAASRHLPPGTVLVQTPPPGAPIMTQQPPQQQQHQQQQYPTMRLQSPLQQHASPALQYVTTTSAAAAAAAAAMGLPLTQAIGGDGRVVMAPQPTVAVYSDPMQAQACNISLQRATLLRPSFPGQDDPHGGGGGAGETPCILASVELDGISYEGTLMPKRTADAANTPSSVAAGSA